MKRIWQSLVVGILLLVPALTLAPAPAGAIDIFHNICTGTNSTGTNASSTDVCKERQKSGNPVLGAIRIAVAILATIIGVASVVVIILSAFKMIRSNGNAQEVATARSGIIYAVIGVAIAILAPVIVGYALRRL